MYLTPLPQNCLDTAGGDETSIYSIELDWRQKLEWNRIEQLDDLQKKLLEDKQDHS